MAWGDKPQKDARDRLRAYSMTFRVHSTLVSYVRYAVTLVSNGRYASYLPRFVYSTADPGIAHHTSVDVIGCASPSTK